MVSGGLRRSDLVGRYERARYPLVAEALVRAALMTTALVAAALVPAVLIAARRPRQPPPLVRLSHHVFE
jgi:hypothetical protein